MYLLLFCKEIIAQKENFCSITHLGGGTSANSKTSFTYFKLGGV